MKRSLWLPPALMLVGTVPYTLIREQLPRDDQLTPVLLTLVLFVVTGFFLRRTCSRKAVLVCAAGLLVFCLGLTVWDFLLPAIPGSYPLAMGLAYLWEALFYPYLSLPLPDIPVFFYAAPAPFPFLWAVFCKPSPETTP